MRKNHLYPLLLCLMLLAFALLLTACGGDEEQKGGLVSSVDPDSPIAQWAQENSVDFGGETIVISLSRFTSAQITDISTHYIAGPDKITSDSVQNKVMERNEAVSSTIGISPRYVYTNLAYDEIKADVEQKVLTPGKDTPDLYIDQVHGMIRTQMAGHLHNVIDKSSSDTSYIDFTTEGWYVDYMSAFNFNSSDKLYLLAGDYFMDVLRFMNTTACNLSLFETLFIKEGGTKLLYNTVSTGAFTHDVFREWCEAAYRDTGAVKGKADREDQLALISCTSGPSIMGYLPSVNVSLYDIKEDGSYAVFLGTDKRSLDAISTVLELLFETPGVYNGGVEAVGDSVMHEYFVRGDVLFMPGTLLCQLESEQFRSMQSDKCVIPYPKLYDSDSRYYVTSHDNARVGGILISSEKRSAVTAWLQAMALTSEDVRETYYEGALKFKYGADAGTTRMLDIIYSSICAPNWITCNYMPGIAGITLKKHPTDAYGIFKSNQNNYSSDYASVRNALTEALRIYMKTFDALK